MGILGAVDPDRCDLKSADTKMIVRNNFEDELEAKSFAMHVIQDVLVDAFRSTSDIKYQGHLAYTIQELLTGWQSVLADFQVESAWMIGAWDDVHNITANTEHEGPSVVKARVLLAMRSGELLQIEESLRRARLVLGAPIAASGPSEYRRAYDALVDLHMIHELELIHETVSNLPPSSQGRKSAIVTLSQILSARLDRTLPTFRVHESLLSMRRTAFSLSTVSRPSITSQIGQSWLASAKIARKAGQWQTTYSAMLQAQYTNARFSFMESGKLVRARGEPLRALQELENSMRILGLVDNKTIDLTREDEQSKRMKAKAQILLARWMNESDRYEASYVLKQFQNAADSAPGWESAFYHLGHFQDQCYRNLSADDKSNRGIKMNFQTIKCFTEAAAYGNKFVYQTIPRLLTLWLDMGERKVSAENPLFDKINSVVASSINSIPVYKWFTAFPQIVSRIGHPNRVVYLVLSKLISSVIREYPNQALWFFASVVNSTKPNRQQRVRTILDQLKSSPANTDSNFPGLITSLHAMIDELLRICNYPIGDRKTLSMRRDFPKLLGMKESNILIPLQSSLTVNLPPVSSMSHRDKRHNPFDPLSPTFTVFYDEIEIMHSLAKPRKITVNGSDGIKYMFLAKPKDDLRKDARLMDFNGIINKLLKTNSESRRRQLHIRTYGVVALNEECGVIQWVPNTIPVRPVLLKYYETRNIPA
ncbi:FAT domain-containing protein [Suillus placidus]|uniref:FAT domain-containing protein n=1 Tax=Suillus placidus TaxID=48579 RepID=A0A9P6ZGA8_9AGAM|nr:FAT domain-containing protein [Suillus placidus]